MEWGQRMPEVGPFLFVSFSLSLSDSLSPSFSPSIALPPSLRILFTSFYLSVSLPVSLSLSFLCLFHTHTPNQSCSAFSVPLRSVAPLKPPLTLQCAIHSSRTPALNPQKEPRSSPASPSESCHRQSPPFNVPDWEVRPTGSRERGLGEGPTSQSTTYRVQQRHQTQLVMQT
jgi:hypothetical protein